MRRPLIAVANVVAVAVVVIALVFVFVARPEGGASGPGPSPTFPPPTSGAEATLTVGEAPDCTIGKMTERYAMVLSTVETGPASDRARIRTDIADKFPHATIKEHALATVSSKQDPGLDKRTVLIYLLAGDTGPIPGGAGGRPPVQGICEMTFYDAETEAFISSLGHATFETTKPEAAPGS
jgi:hypothetical protein